MLLYHNFVTDFDFEIDLFKYLVEILNGKKKN